VTFNSNDKVIIKQQEIQQKKNKEKNKTTTKQRINRTLSKYDSKH